MSTARRQRATMPTERSMSAPVMPRTARMASTALGTSLSVTMRLSADLETRYASVAAAVVPVSRASPTKFRPHRTRRPGGGPGWSGRCGVGAWIAARGAYDKSAHVVRPPIAVHLDGRVGKPGVDERDQRAAGAVRIENHLHRGRPGWNR